MTDVFKGWKPSLAFYFQAAALACSLVGVIIYGASGKNIFTPELSAGVLGVAVAFMILQAAGCFFCGTFKRADMRHVLSLCQYFFAVLAFLSFALYISYNVNYLASVLVSIDGTKITGGFVAAAIFLILSCALAIAAAVLIGRSALAGEEGGTRDERE